MPTALVEKRNELEAKRSQLAAIFDELTAGTKQADVDTRAEISKRNAELDSLVDEVKGLRELDEIEQKTRAALREQSQPATAMQFPGGAAEGGKAAQADLMLPNGQVINLGRKFTESPEYKGMIVGKANPRGMVELPDVQLSRAFKTTFSTTAGFAPYPARQAFVVPFAIRRVMVPDIIPTDDTTEAAIIYMEETTFTNAADVVAEAGPKPEGALAFTQRTVPLEVVATWLPVTRQQLDDVPQVEAVINNRLTVMVQLTEEYQILNGNGTSPQLQGFYNKSGVQTQAKGADPVPSAIRKAMTLVQATGFADPTAVVMHPNDVQDMMLLQDTTGQYIFGGPGAPAPERVWGLPIVNTTAATENTGLVGDFAMFAHLWRRQGITIDVSDSHSDYFVKNLLAIRAEERVALTIYRPAAFAKITGV